MITARLTDVRRCMNELLCKDSFDAMLLSEATINTYASFVIDGHRLDDYYTKEELEEIDAIDKLLSYSLFRGQLYDIIKGKKVPLSFKIILSMPHKVTSELISEAGMDIESEGVGLVAIFKFTGGELTLTTGTSFSSFTLDKSLERVFDKWFLQFLISHGIDADVMG